MSKQGDQCCAPSDHREAKEQLAGFDNISELIDEASVIVLCAHTSPDGDALGSVLGLLEIIRAGWPSKSVTPLLADDAPVPRIYQFLPHTEELVPANKYEGEPDLFIAVDLCEMGRLNLAQDVCKRAKRVAVLDHHPSKKPLDGERVVRPSAAAAGIIIAEFALHKGIAITPSIAQNLMCAVMTDTGRFQYQNADGEAFKVASLLVESGASPSDISLAAGPNP